MSLLMVHPLSDFILAFPVPATNGTAAMLLATDTFVQPMEGFR